MIEFKNLPLPKVRGDRLSAVEVNQIVESVKEILKADPNIGGAGIGVSSAVTAQWVWATNVGELEIDPLRPVGIVDLAMGEEDSTDRLTTEIVLEVINPEESTDNFEGHYAVAAEHISPGDNGRVWTMGICPVYGLSTAQVDGDGDPIVKTYCELSAEEDDDGNPALGKDYLTCSTGGSTRLVWRKEDSEFEQLVMIRLGFASIVTAPVELVPVKITAKVNYNTYIGDEYGDGTDEGATLVDVTIRVLQIGADETIPDDTIIPAWLQKWGGVLTRTIDVARDY